MKDVTSRVTLHANELVILDAKIDEATVTTSADQNKQFLHLDVAEPVPVGTHRSVLGADFCRTAAF